MHRRHAALRRFMNNTFRLFLLILCAAGSALAQNAGHGSPDILKAEPSPAQGFAYPYYLYVPKALREAGGAKGKRTMLVIPNNTGKFSDELAVHEEDVKRRLRQNAQLADRMGVAILMPVFPRPQTDWRVYTHALDRDSMLTDKDEFARFDLQLVAMIDDARARFAAEKLNFDDRVLLLGFSASGMFANRFAFLHPKRVKAAAVGSPGGWAIAPAASFRERALRYPIGAGDFKTVSGKKLDLKSLRRVPLFMFLGGEDDNDSVVFRDSYEKEDEELIFALFGKTPVERWGVSQTLYRESRLNAEFRLYPNVKHTVTKEMVEDILAFFRKHTEAQAGK